MREKRGQPMTAQPVSSRHAEIPAVPRLPPSSSRSHYSPPPSPSSPSVPDTPIDFHSSCTNTGHRSPGHYIQPGISIGMPSCETESKTCFQYTWSPTLLAGHNSSEGLGEGSDRFGNGVIPGEKSRSISFVKNLCGRKGDCTVKGKAVSESSWDGAGPVSGIDWDKDSVRQAYCRERPGLDSCSPDGGNQSGMSGVPRRRCRHWLGVGLPLAAFLYVLLYCNSSAWSSFSLQHHPLHSTLSGSGFRKLLEDQEKARLAFNVSNAGLTQRLPSCIIIGVRKCGTRALLEFLDLHPDIVTAEDEMHFFSDDERYRLGLDWYRHLMPLSLPHQITMEKTPGYFISPISPSRIHRMNSSIKLIVLLRHPTTRTISDYTQIFYNKLFKNETLDAFEDIAIDRETGSVNTRYKAVQISMYHQHFRHWTNIFPRAQIHVVDGDNLITDPVAEIQKIETFLGVEHRIDYSILYYNSTRGFYCMRVNATYDRCLGASKGRKHPRIQQSVVRKLNRFFQPHNKKLYDLIQRRFSWS